MYQTRDFEIFPVSAMEKVRGGCRPQLFEDEGTALTGERAAFQVAYRSVRRTLTDLSYRVEGLPEGHFSVYAVRCVPCSYPKAEGSDDYVLEDRPCLMPDILSEITPAGIVAGCGLWQSFYLTVDGLPAGRYPIRFTLCDEKGEILGCVGYTLTVLPAELPENDLLCTFWIHYDALAEQYGMAPFSDGYNAVLRSYLKSAVGHGMTMLLTPLFTPPLDTGIGGERMTVQLVDVMRDGDGYRFGFDRLGAFMELAEDCGIRYFEMSHLFTQWGAKTAPKIIVRESGEDKRLFGWDTEALGDAYTSFLAAFLPALREWLIDCGRYGRCFFHLSDEPDADALAHYKECSAFVRRYLPDAGFIDAMSHYDYYEQKLVDHPFVALDATDPFVEKHAKGYYVYYCTAQRSRFVSNRFLSMPLERTRILGLQLYLNDVRGFLHWGYNYYYAFLTREKIDPYATTDCMGKYQSGDAFTVYPGKEGAVGSLRNEAFLQGVQDYLALRLLENRIGREAVCGLLKDNGMQENFFDYPKNTAWIVRLRQRINEKIAQTTQSVK